MMFGQVMNQQFNDVFGVHSSEYAQGIKDCKNGLAKQSNDPEYLKGFVHQVRVEAEQEKKKNG